MRASLLTVRSVFLLVALSSGCFRGVNPEIDKIQCRGDNNCPEHYTCVKADGMEFGRCLSGKADGGSTRDLGPSDADALAPKLDGAFSESAIRGDARLLDSGAAFSDTGSVSDTGAPQTADVRTDPNDPGVVDAPVTFDGSAGVDGPALVDAPSVEDAPAVPDALAAPDALRQTQDTAVVDAPITNSDTAPPCNGGCCRNADCPLSAPVCNSANKCVGCTAEQDCSGRSLTACNTSTGACVQCTTNGQCSGSNATCDLTTNTCVGCTQRSDCPGTCQTCSNRACVPVKNADDPTKCTGTCDSAGECKAKKGQKCSSLAGGCVSGTTCSPDDTCCDRACSGSCEACDVTPGTCTVLTAGSLPHTGHTPCSGTGTCAGSCQGAANGSCTLPTSACGTSSCTGTSYQAAGTCSQGTCAMPVPVTCKTGATCSSGACACSAGKVDCGATCANLDSDPKNCGACGHDCLGGPCEGGFCKPYKLAEVASGYIGTLVPDGGKVYAITQQQFMFDTTKVWQMDAVVPGASSKIPPDQPRGVHCVLDGTMVWSDGTDESGNIVFSYCSVSGCLASTKKFSHPVPATGSTSMDGQAFCDVAAKEMVWLESTWVDGSDDRGYTLWRSSPSGTNLRKMTSFTVNQPSGTSFSYGFPVGRTDRLIYTTSDASTSRSYSVVTTTANASPTLLASGANAGPNDLMYSTYYGNDTLLVWTIGGVSYRAPLPAGVGTGTPAVFYNGTITSGILDNNHFYGFFENAIGYMHWCVPPSCSSSAILSSDFSSARAFAQDAGAIYWGVMNPDTMDGFSIWKVAKQPY